MTELKRKDISDDEWITYRDDWKLYTLYYKDISCFINIPMCFDDYDKSLLKDCSFCNKEKDTWAWIQYQDTSNNKIFRDMVFFCCEPCFKAFYLGKNPKEAMSSLAFLKMKELY